MYNSNMNIKRAYKFRLQPNKGQRIQFAQTAGCVRLVWNKGLALEKELLDKKEKRRRFAGLCKEVTSWKREDETSFLQLVHSQPLQQVCKDLDRALSDGLKKVKGFPRFKKKGLHDSFRYPQGFKFDGNKVFLPKIGWVRFRQSQDIVGTPKNVTVSKRAGEWYIAVQVELEVEDPKHPNSEQEVGIDMGIARFATLSNGNVLKPHNAYRQNQKELARAQRKLARQKKGSKNREKQKWKIQRLHKRIADSRLDYLHKATTWIAKNHGKVVLEDLKVASMSKSAKGTLEKPGRNVAAKSGLNKSILDQGWFEFKRQLGYKLEWFGGELVLINPRHTSQRCHACGEVSRENRKTQAKFECGSCGHQDNADNNAALNILAAGHAVSACGDISSVAS
jgi:putative transposase